MVRAWFCLGALGTALADPDFCASRCGAQAGKGCCKYLDTSDDCEWCPDGYVDGGSSVAGGAAANCHHDDGSCDGWSWGKDCSGSCSPFGPSPSPPSPTPPPSPGLAFPSGDGSVTPNFFVNSQAWTATDGERMQVHSGQVWQDKVTKRWHWLGNNDPPSMAKTGGGQNQQIVVYSSDNLYGPWEPEVVLLTIPQAQSIFPSGTDVLIMERPKIYQADGAYYLFVHVDRKYDLGHTGIVKFEKLEGPSDSNPFTVVFEGRPGINPNRGNNGFFVLDSNIFDDEVSGHLWYAAASDAYNFQGQGMPCSDDPECTDHTKCEFCGNTGIVVFSVDKACLKRGKCTKEAFVAQATLPGRWEGMTMFRKPSEPETFYILCSGQDGWGPNPISLFSGELPAKRRLSNTLPDDDYQWPAPPLFTCRGQPFSGSANGFNTQPLGVLPNPYDSKHGIYIGDNWVHGPGKGLGNCPVPGIPQHGEECEPWQGCCPCNFPNSTCPRTSSPYDKAGYVWLSFPWDQVGETDYLFCAHGSWSMRSPPGKEETCYTFNIFPAQYGTQDFVATTDYSGKQMPYIVSSCGFSVCPGWPMTVEDNKNASCCETLGGSFTEAKYLGVCSKLARSDVCGGACAENKNGNIPGGHGGCLLKPFDPSKATLILGSGETDCTRYRGGVVDPCHGPNDIPSAERALFA